VDFQIRRADFLDLTGDQGGESIQILACGRSATVSLIDGAFGRFVFDRPAPDVPEITDGFGDKFLIVGLIHNVSQWEC
jgi:hypothetical protein